MAEIILFEHANFHGRHKHIFRDEPNLNAADDHDFNDITSSIVVLLGNWQCFTDAGFQGESSQILPPGVYPFVENPDVGIANDSISSVRLITTTCDQLAAQLSDLQKQQKTLQDKLHNPNKACEEEGLTGTACQLFLKSLGTQLDAIRTEIANVQKQQLGLGCLGTPPQTVEGILEADAQIWTDNKNVPGPFTRHFSIPLIFRGVPGSIWQVTNNTFSLSFPTKIPGLTITVTLQDHASISGQFTPLSSPSLPGTMLLTAPLHADAGIFGSSDITVPLSTRASIKTSSGEFNGQALKADGHIELVGQGLGKGGPLDNNLVQVRTVGTLLNPPLK
jgi:Beta/Gamma crystallin